MLKIKRIINIIRMLKLGTGSKTVKELEQIIAKFYYDCGVLGFKEKYGYLV